MPGLFDSLSLGQRSLQAQRQGVEVTGHNLANVNTPGYARQRVVLQASQAVQTGIGDIGSGVDGVAVEQARSSLLDGQIQSESSVRASLETRQSALQNAQAILGSAIDNSSTSSSSSASAAQNGTNLPVLVDAFFNSFQALAAQPASTDVRQSVLSQASQLATRLNDVDQKLTQLSDNLTAAAKADANSANQILNQIAGLDQQIGRSEAGNIGSANDLRDQRQAQVEELSKYIKVDTSESADGTFTVSAGASTLVSGDSRLDTLGIVEQAGVLEVRTVSSGSLITPTGGSLNGILEARDGDIAGLKSQVNLMAGHLISQVNAIHAGGYNLNGTTGNDFFTGTGAATIAVNPALLQNSSLIQASGDASARSDNTVAKALANLASQAVPGLDGKTFGKSTSQILLNTAQSLAGVNSQLDDQTVVEDMLNQQRDSLGGVSMDEELSNMVKYQKAFQASARLINTIDEMLDTVLSLKR